MNASHLLLVVDALMNLALGSLLATFPTAVIRVFGAPIATSGFYPSILGAVAIGIAAVLLVEIVKGTSFNPPGAIWINFCVAGAPGSRLLSGKLRIPLRGYVFLSPVTVLLFGISGADPIILGRTRDS